MGTEAPGTVPHSFLEKSKSAFPHFLGQLWHLNCFTNKIVSSKNKFFWACSSAWPREKNARKAFEKKAFFAAKILARQSYTA